MSSSSSAKWSQVSSALAAFWEGGVGPTKSKVTRAMGAAGIEIRDTWTGNKSDLVLQAFKQARFPEKGLLATELIDLLASEENFDNSVQGFDLKRIEKLRETLQAVGCTLQDDGSAIWTEQTTDNEPQLTLPPGVIPTTPVPSPVHAAKSGNVEKEWGPSVPFLLDVLRDLPAAAGSLTRPRRGKKDHLQIWDEYDVQDFIEVALRLLYKDVRPEIYTPSVAGSSSRVDFFIRAEQVVVEAKVVHSGHSSKKVADELIIDIHRYQTMQGVKDLICVIYDLDGSLKNPIGHELDLSKDPEEGMRVHVVATPWPFSARPAVGATASADGVPTSGSPKGR